MIRRYEGDVPGSRTVAAAGRRHAGSVRGSCGAGRLHEPVRLGRLSPGRLRRTYRPRPASLTAHERLPRRGFVPSRRPTAACAVRSSRPAATRLSCRVRRKTSFPWVCVDRLCGSVPVRPWRARPIVASGDRRVARDGHPNEPITAARRTLAVPSSRPYPLPHARRD